MESAPFFSSFRQPHCVHSPPGSPHPAHITTSHGTDRRTDGRLTCVFMLSVLCAQRDKLNRVVSDQLMRAHVQTAPSRRKDGFAIVRGRRRFGHDARPQLATRPRSHLTRFDAAAAVLGKRDTGRFAIVRGR